MHRSTLTQLCHCQLLLLAEPSEGFTGQWLWKSANWSVAWMTDDQISILPVATQKVTVSITYGAFQNAMLNSPFERKLASNYGEEILLKQMN